MPKVAKITPGKQKLLNNQHKILVSAKVLFEAASANLRLAENAMDALLDNIAGDGTYNIRYYFQDGKVVVEGATDKPDSEDSP